ncbi:MAG: YidC/Oxa1 family membrane protein insertase [Clostridia bacterium]|nr:YidC/Oxa1 family membrane protein insertase [Clostridia bacterium]
MLDLISTPFGYLMRFFYQLTNNYALALLIFALIVKLVLLPLTIHQRSSSVKQARLRPKERAIRKRYEGRTDPEARIQMATELQAMYKEEHYSVASGCLPLLIQLPIILALYNIVCDPLTHISRLTTETINAVQNKALELIKAGELVLSGASESSTSLRQIQMTAALQSMPEAFSGIVPADILLPDFTLFGVNMSSTPTIAFSLLILFPILAALSQWLSSFVMTKMMPSPQDPTAEKTPETEAAERTMKNMNIMMPLLTLFFAFNLPAIMSLYWVYQSMIGMVTHVIVYKAMPIPSFTDEEYAMVEAEMNRGYVPIPAPKASSSAKRSLHHIDDDEDEYEESVAGSDARDSAAGVIEVTDFSDASEEDTSAHNDAYNASEEERSHEPPEPKEEPKPKVRYDKNGNPIRSLHYIDFDDEE